MDGIKPNLAGMTPPDTATDAPPHAARRSRTRKVRVLAAVGVMVGIFLLAGPWVMGLFSQVHITDARIGAAVVRISSEVAGRVTELPVAMGDTVAPGDLLARIDLGTAQLQLDAVQSRLAAADAQVAQVEAQKSLLQDQLRARHEAAQAGLSAAEANHEATLAVLGNAQSRFNRVSQLVDRNISAQQDLDDARVAMDTARQQERAARAAIEAATANIASVTADTAQLEVLDRQIATMIAERTGIEVERSLKQIDLAHRTIAADFHGIVDATSVDVGEYVTPGTRLIMYHAPDRVWIDANVKETDLAKIRLGSKARITVDGYPGQTFIGAVTNIGGVATSQLALLPSPNPSGNFTKVTQRLPIRLSIEAEGTALRPGMMVEVHVDVAG
ncbi:HlyD family secretion protein [Phaeovulum sp. NW3]|uniref:HlyD family secretion protein n=1 Tax=Phaeovulum sp. NW3 TaxID=2934933 RepID=UPI0020226450|nr:HlyD family secretion protein [Phaeovulum sp. NW3]MCL7466387.1 HlyD family secretion protein [Phaeovulum sp. NW3]